MPRLLIAFCLAPGVPALIASLVAAICGVEDEFISVICAFAGVSYLAALALGIPAHVLLKRRDIHQVIPCIGAGAVIALVGEVVFVVLPVALLKNPEHVITVTSEAAFGFSALVAASGALAAFVFWLIAIRAAAVNGHESSAH
jgi:hypothetical protein